MPRRFFIFALTVLAMAGTLSLGAGAAEIGKPIPSDLSAKDAASQVRNFQNLTGKNGVILVFFRSADW